MRAQADTFAVDKVDDDVAGCGKKTMADQAHTPGVMVYWCLHGHSVGFNLLFKGEGPGAVFHTLRERMPNVEVVIYDNACNLARYTAARDPTLLAFARGRMFHDRLHEENHTQCSSSFRIQLAEAAVGELKSVNTQAAEQGNKRLRGIAQSFNSMGVSTAVLMLRLFLHVLGVKKLLEQLKEARGMTRTATMMAPMPRDLLAPPLPAHLAAPAATADAADAAADAAEAPAAAGTRAAAASTRASTAAGTRATAAFTSAPAAAGARATAASTSARVPAFLDMPAATGGASAGGVPTSSTALVAVSGGGGGRFAPAAAAGASAVAGLRNFGNSCYINSVVQALGHLPPVRSWVEQRVKGHARRCTCFCCVTSRLHAEMFAAPGTVVVPTVLVKKLPSLPGDHTFTTSVQEDAQEFMSALLTAFEESPPPRHVPPGPAPAAPAPWGMQVCSTRTCETHGHVSATYEWCNPLEMAIGRETTLVGCIREFRAPEPVKYTCDEGDFHTERGSRRDTLSELPPVLMVRLKRFVNVITGRNAAGILNAATSKVNKHVSFPMALDVVGCPAGEAPASSAAGGAARARIPEFSTASPCPVASDMLRSVLDELSSRGDASASVRHAVSAIQNAPSDAEAANAWRALFAYTLMGVTVHVGRSLLAGHYYSYVRAAAGQWMCANDGSVLPAVEADVLGAQAYLLFYQAAYPEALAALTQLQAASRMAAQAAKAAARAPAAAAGGAAAAPAAARATAAAAGGAAAAAAPAAAGGAGGAAAAPAAARAPAAAARAPAAAAGGAAAAPAAARATAAAAGGAAAADSPRIVGAAGGPTRSGAAAATDDAVVVDSTSSSDSDSDRGLAKRPSGRGGRKSRPKHGRRR